MIIVQLVGGLGNQMFQYAAGKSLAYRLGTELKMDVRLFEHYPDRFYCLHCFHITEQPATPNEIFRLTASPITRGQRWITQAKRGLARYVRYPGRVRALLEPTRRIYREPFHHFDPNFFNTPDNTYLEGYWQSGKYFAPIEDLIRREFIFNTPAQGKNLELARLISNTEAVCIHVRRGDYVANHQVNQAHGVCSPAYYEAAVDEMVKEVARPVFFVFSDDQQWVRENLRLRYPVCAVDHNPADRPWEDLRLMGLCRHHILANSSFGWWGAWLRSSPDGVVLVPEPWFRMKELSVQDFLPPQWRRLPI